MVIDSQLWQAASHAAETEVKVKRTILLQSIGGVLISLSMAVINH